MMIAVNVEVLEQKAKKIRRDIVDLSEKHKNGHIAPALSTVDILVALYDAIMTPDDQFILSKGHGCLGLFAVLRDKGFDPHIAGHPDRDTANGIECTSGSLGHGIAIAAGKALARKIQGRSGRIFVMVGDGECQEGSVWETLNIARKCKLDNLVVIIDHNKLQALDTAESILAETNLAGKCEAFGAQVYEVAGHNMEALIDSLQQINNSIGKPHVIVAHTKKGYGISFMTGSPGWHVRGMNDVERAQARAELA